MNASDVLDWIKARATEPSTWAGIAAGAAAIGAALQSNTGFWSALVAGVMAVIMKEKS